MSDFDTVKKEVSDVILDVDMAQTILTQSRGQVECRLTDGIHADLNPQGCEILIDLRRYSRRFDTISIRVRNKMNFEESQKRGRYSRRLQINANEI